MSKSKSKITKGLAFVKTTGEPVYVRSITEQPNLFNETTQTAQVVRGVVTSEGIKYICEPFSLDELETSYAQTLRNAKRTVDFETQIQDLREKAEAKRYSFPPEVEKAIVQHQAKLQNPSRVN